ncbi:MAG: ROK family protein [Cyclobacteriaceae bacterium]|nr:ROK family protein [Cyclobacteriaceae bacterium]
MSHFFGIDIGGSNIKIGLVDSEKGLVDKIKYPTIILRENGKFVENFSRTLKTEFERHPEVKETGIGIPGTISRDGRSTLELPNLEDLDNTDLVETLEADFPGKIFYLENDAHAAALGEYYFGSEKLPENYIFITLGTGVGGAAIINKKVFRGGDGNAMEIGHIMTHEGKELEHIIGKAGLTEMINDFLKSKKSILGTNITSWDTKTLVSAAQEEDKVAIKIFKKIGLYLGEALVSTVRLFDIKTIIVGGGISQSYDFVYEPMKRVLMENLTPYYTRELDIKKATLGNNAGILGAAALCFK